MLPKATAFVSALNTTAWVNADWSRCVFPARQAMM